VPLRLLPEQWFSDLAELRRELRNLVIHRSLFRDVTTALQSVAPDSPDTWLKHYVALYAASQATAIRRLSRSTGAAIAIDRSLKSFRDHPAQFEACRLNNTIQLDPVADLERLEQAVSPIVPWVDRTIAHLDPRGAPNDPYTWGTLDRAIDLSVELVRSYSRALDDVDYVIDDFGISAGWKMAFSKPLFSAVVPSHLVDREVP
jgi:hypothetical protein